jgi:hypothetical protein
MSFTVGRVCGVLLVIAVASLEHTAAVVQQFNISGQLSSHARHPISAAALQGILARNLLPVPSLELFGKNNRPSVWLWVIMACTFGMSATCYVRRVVLRMASNTHLLFKCQLNFLCVMIYSSTVKMILAGEVKRKRPTFHTFWVTGATPAFRLPKDKTQQINRTYSTTIHTVLLQCLCIELPKQTAAFAKIWWWTNGMFYCPSSVPGNRNFDLKKKIQ